MELVERPAVGRVSALVLSARWDLTKGRFLFFVFRHRDKHIVVSVHGDGFTAAGPKSALDWFETAMRTSTNSQLVADSGQGHLTLRSWGAVSLKYVGCLGAKS